VDRPYLATLPARLAAAVSVEELELETRPLEGSGITRSFRPGQLRMDLRVLPGSVPDVTLELDPPADARELCAAWGIERPIAVSPDVHQTTWCVLAAGEELADPHGRRIASNRITAGRWDILPKLTARPAGESPGVVSGASPAYDLHERRGAVASIEIAPTALPVRALEADHPDAMELLAAMASAYPVWRAGWTVDPAATFVAVYDATVPVAGAAITDGDDGLARASAVCLPSGQPGYGAALLDALEAVARDRGHARLRLDQSAFLPLGDDLPYTPYGYVVGPPYDGDTDVDVWAEKDLSLPPIT
jgi:hypothetical protein